MLAYYFTKLNVGPILYLYVLLSGDPFFFYSNDEKNCYHCYFYFYDDNLCDIYSHVQVVLKCLHLTDVFFFCFFFD